MIGSRRWASKPADSSSHVGSKRRITGSTTLVDGAEVHVAGRALGDGHVEGVPRAGARRPVSVSAPVPGYSGYSWMRDVQDAGVAVEDVLRAVAVVGVVVDDDDPLAPLGEVGGGDGHVVQEAEAHGAGRRGVMAGRAHGAEGGVALAAVERLHRRQAGAGGQHGGVPGRRRRHRCRRRSGRRRPGRSAPWRRGTTPDGPAPARRASPARGSSGDERVGDAVAAGALEHGLEPRRPLGMPAAGVVVEVARMRREQYGHQVGGYRRSTVNSVEPPRAGSLTGSRRRPRTARRRPPAPATVGAPRRDRRPHRPVARRTAHRPAHRGCPGPRRRPRRVVRAALADAAASGYRAAVTGALGERERAPFLDAGLAPRWPGSTSSSARSTPATSPRPTGSTLRRIRRSEWPVVAAVDAAAFAPFWRLGIDGIVDARRATPSNRMRVADRPPRRRRRLRRVRPQRRAGLRAAHRRRSRASTATASARRSCSTACTGSPIAVRRSALVNTQIGNERALHLYRRTGFRLLRERLVVLGRSLDDRA